MARFVNVLIAFLCGVVWLKRTEGWQMAQNPSLQRMVKTLVPTLLHASLCHYLEHMWWLPFWHADSLFMITVYVLASASCLPPTSHTKQPSKMFEGTSLLRSSEVNFEAGRGYLLAVQVAQQGQFKVLWFWHSLTNSLKCVGYSMACEMQFEISVGTTPSCVITVARHKLSGLTRAAYLGGAFFGSWWTGLTDHDIRATSQELLGRHIYCMVARAKVAAETCHNDHNVK